MPIAWFPLEDYTKGLLLPIERKSVEPMAARLAPGRVRQMHQSLHHIVAMAPWSDDDLLRRVRKQVLPAMMRRETLAAWIVDDSGFPKKGTHSVGVTRQYCGQLGKQENCRVAVNGSLATEQASLPVASRLYLPEVWANDRERCRQAGVPAEVRFQTKPEIAVEQIRLLVKEDVPHGVVLADAAYGNDHDFREGLESLDLSLPWAFSPRRRSGVRKGSLFHRPRKARWGVRHVCYAAMNSISHSRPKSLPSAWAPKICTRSLGALTRGLRCAPASQHCAYAWRIATTGATSRVPSSGC